VCAGGAAETVPRETRLWAVVVHRRQMETTRKGEKVKDAHVGVGSLQREQIICKTVRERYSLSCGWQRVSPNYCSPSAFVLLRSSSQCTSVDPQFSTWSKSKSSAPRFAAPCGLSTSLVRGHDTLRLVEPRLKHPPPSTITRRQHRIPLHLP